MEPNAIQNSELQRGSIELLRRYIQVGSWVGNVVFIGIGVKFGLEIGGVAGQQFFGSLFLVDQLGSLAGKLGSVIGVIIGLLTYWAVTVIAFSFLATILYLSINRSLPGKG